jgi:hypothetical protein
MASEQQRTLEAGLRACETGAPAASEWFVRLVDTAVKMASPSAPSMRFSQTPVGRHTKAERGRGLFKHRRCR